MRCGRFDLHVLPDSLFRLDGGAMFGVVPRVLWERKKPPDEQHRIQMTSQSLLIVGGDDVILVDTGLGDKLDAKSRQIFALPENGERLLERLGHAGFAPEDVTHVLLTHLHFDHCGWNTVLEGGHLRPTFPHAHYWLQRDEVHFARNPNPRDRVSYLAENFEPLFDAGLVEIWDDEAEPVAGVRLVRAAGHTRGMAVVVVDGEPSAGPDAIPRAVFLADLVPTAAHLPIPWVMGYDLYPVETMEHKAEWLAAAAEGAWLCVFQHDPETPLARLAEEKPGRYRAVPVTASAAEH